MHSSQTPLSQTPLLHECDTSAATQAVFRECIHHRHRCPSHLCCMNAMRVLRRRRCAANATECTTECNRGVCDRGDTKAAEARSRRAATRYACYKPDSCTMRDRDTSVTLAEARSRRAATRYACSKNHRLHHLSRHTCVCVCACGWVCVRAHACVCVCLFVCARACVCLRVRGCVYI